MDWKKLLNYDVLKSLLLDVPIGITLLAALLKAIGIGDSMIGYVTGIIIASAGLCLGILGAVKRALNQTDSGKANTINSLDDDGLQQVVPKLSDSVQTAVAVHVEEKKNGQNN